MKPSRSAQSKSSVCAASAAPDDALASARRLASSPLVVDQAEADPRIARLPKAPRALAEKLGYAAGLRLMEQFGGRQLTIPGKITSSIGAVLSRALGDEAARVMVELFGPDTIEIPSGALLRSAALKEEIVNHRGSANEAARDLKVSRRYVRMVRDAAKAARRAAALREADGREANRVSAPANCPAVRPSTRC